jgi:hypothetical protein
MDRQPTDGEGSRPWRSAEGSGVSGVGNGGVDLGPRAGYTIVGGRVRFVGRKAGPLTQMMCPYCRSNGQGPLPPRGAFQPRIVRVS